MKQKTKIHKTKIFFEMDFLKGTYQENEKETTDLKKIFVKDF